MFQVHEFDGVDLGNGDENHVEFYLKADVDAFLKKRLSDSEDMSYELANPE